MNIAKGSGTAVMGGYKNTASSTYSVVTGGADNEASGIAAVVIGGDENKATAGEAIVAGGYQNQSTGVNSSVFGGLLDEASGFGATAVGGNGTKAIGQAATGLGGQANFAIGPKSTIAGGGGNVTVGETSSAFGGWQNLVTGADASAFGGYRSTVNGLFSTGVAGGSTDDEAVLSLAAGNQALVTNSGVEKTYLTGEEYYKIATDINNGKKDLTGFYIYDPTYDGSAPGDMRYIHYDKPSTAIGYQATADTPGVVAFGHDKGDVSSVKKTWKQKATKEGNDVDGYKYYDANHKEITQEDYRKLANGDGTWNDYTQDPIGTETKTYDSAYYNRLVKVADGVEDHDVVVMEQLKQYAEKDAGNIGKNITVYKTDENGNVQLGDDKKPIEDKDATTKAQKDSKDAWGQALGVGTFTTGTSDKATDASTSDQLVTGNTLYDYDKPTGSQNYVNVNNTTGQNLSALDAQVKANAVTLNDKTHNIKYYSVNENLPKVDNYSNEGNDGAVGMGSIAAGFNTHADGIASTVAGSYSGVLNQNSKGAFDLRGATALSYGAFNFNQNTDTTKKTYSGVANSIVGQANATTDSNAAIIYGAGNTVTNSYRDIDTKKFNRGKVEQDLARNDAVAVAKDLQQAVPTSGGQVMVMGGGNNVESAYMTQVVGVGNTVKGNQVYTKDEKTGEWNWTTDTNDETAIKDYDPEKSSQYNYVDGFSNEVINGKHDYVIGANNKLSGDSYDDSKAQPIKRSNRSNIVIGDNHTLTREQNTVIIGSSDTENTQTKARDAVIIGHNANATNDTGADNAVAIGLSANATGGNAVTIGVNTSAGANSITIGSESSAISGSNIAIGRYARVYGDNVTNAVALGKLAEAHVADGVAIGSNSIASTVAGKTGYDAQGRTHAATDADYAAWVSTDAAVSVGGADHEVKYTDKDNQEHSKIVKSTRQITNLAAGTNDTDAVNVAQLKSAQSSLTEDLTSKGLKFAANSGNKYTAKLGTTVKIQGTAKKPGHEYTADNLTTEIDGSGNITILMDKNISADKIAVNGKDGKDAVSIAGEDGVGHIGLTGPAGTNGKNGADGKPGTSIDISVKNGYDGAAGTDGKDGIKGANGVDGTSLTRVVYTDQTGEHQVATMEDGLKFKGDDETVIAKKLNNQLDIIGGAAGTLTDGNIGVKSTTDGKLKVQLAQDLKGITSITNQKTEGDKTTGAKIELSTDGTTTVSGGNVSVSGGKITNVGSGADASGNYTDATKTNAANIGDVQAITESATTGLTDKGLKFAANSGNKYTAKLGTTVKIQGTAKKPGHEYTADNLTTEIDGSGNITILMDKNISADKIAVNGKDGKDAVSIAGEDGVGHIGLTGPAGTNGKNGADGKPGTSIDISVKNGYDGAAGTDGKDGIKGANGVDGTSLTRVVYTDQTGEHQVATMEDGLKFKGDDETVIAKKLNNQLDIIGGAAGTLTDGNIGVKSTTDGKLKVQLAQDLTKITSISNQTTTGAGDQAKTTGARIDLGSDGTTTISGGDVNVSGNKITHVGSGIEAEKDGKYAVTDDNKSNAANIGDVDHMVNQAVGKLSNDTKVDLARKANVDASNLTTDDVTKWQEKLGNGEVESDNTGLVTGDTVFKAVDIKANRDGSNLTGTEADSFSEKIARGEVKDGENRAVSGDAVNKAISKVTGDVNTKLDGKANTSLDNITDGGRDVIRDLAKGSIGMENGNHTTVSSREVDGVKTFKVDVTADGKVESGNSGPISGGTAFTELRPADGTYVKQANTTAANLTALDKGLKTTSDLIHTNGDTIQIGGTSTATKIDVSSKDANGKTTGRVITGVVTDASDANSAANVGYVNGITSASNEQIYHDMNMQYNHVENDISRAAAGSNALAALHPMQEFDPDDKAQFALGYGHYRNSNAGAVGAFYQPDENSMVNFGVSFGNGDAGINAGVTFKFGPGGSGHHALTKTQMAKVIDAQSKEIDELKKDNADKDKRIDALEQKMTEILAKLDKSKD